VRFSCRLYTILDCESLSVRDILCGAGVGPRKAVAAEMAAERALLQLSPFAHALVLSTMS
jgi:hypothetical protein